MSVVLGGESYSALVEGMQNALHQLGGVPVEIRTDSLSAAWRSLSDGERTQQTGRYAAFCEHYDVLASHNNPGKAMRMAQWNRHMVTSNGGYVRHCLCAETPTSPVSTSIVSVVKLCDS